MKDAIEKIKEFQGSEKDTTLYLLRLGLTNADVPAKLLDKIADRVKNCVLSRNKLTEIPASVYNMTNLEELNLQGNQVRVRVGLWQ